MKTRKNTHKVILAISASLTLLASSALAAKRTLPTPPPSGFVDAESSVVLPFPTNEGRRVKLTITAPAAPTNAIQVAFGRDANGDADLQPEETALVLGVDCGVPFVREEGRARTPAAPQSQNNGFALDGDCGGPGVSALPTNLVSCTFSFRQPYATAKRYTHAKVTTRNMAETNAVIVAEVNRSGLALLVR